jgi:hypothetical protein
VPGSKGQKWTKKHVLQQLAISGAHARAVGSAETVADILEHWVREAHVDGFNISYATTPQTFDDLIQYLWPELRKRGVLQEEYAGTSMRENYLADGEGARVRERHPAARYRDRKWGGEEVVVVVNGKEAVVNGKAEGTKVKDEGANPKPFSVEELNADLLEATR